MAEIKMKYKGVDASDSESMAEKAKELDDLKVQMNQQKEEQISIAKKHLEDQKAELQEDKANFFKTF